MNTPSWIVYGRQVEETWWARDGVWVSFRIKGFANRADAVKHVRQRLSSPDNFKCIIEFTGIYYGY